MITEYTVKDSASILTVINDAAVKYKGVIPDECWHEPYMSPNELREELEAGVRMFGYAENRVLLGVMATQEVEDVTLIRHAYTLSGYQGKGIGTSLLRYLFEINKSVRLLVGTWQDATWAINFYLKHGFVLHTKKQKDQLLEQYWQVPLQQMQTSVVLERQMELNG